MKTIKFIVNGEEVAYSNEYHLDPRFTLVNFLHKLGLKSNLIIVMAPINVLGQFDAVEIFPT